MKHVDIFDLPDELRALVGECELTGHRTAFDREGRSVAVLVSYDEYLAMRETIDIARTPVLIAAMRKSEAEAERGSIIQTFETLERIRAPKTISERISGDETLRQTLAKIDDDPITGAPLFEPMRGLWSHRDGSLRVIYRIVAEARYVLILSISSAEGE